MPQAALAWDCGPADEPSSHEPVATHDDAAQGYSGDDARVDGSEAAHPSLTKAERRTRQHLEKLSARHGARV